MMLCNDFNNVSAIVLMIMKVKFHLPRCGPFSKIKAHFRLLENTSHSNPRPIKTAGTLNSLDISLAIGAI
jgi:hypothetical protein